MDKAVKIRNARARAKYIAQELASTRSGTGSKESDILRSALRMGFEQPYMTANNHSFDDSDESQQPLSQYELLNYNTWFYLHPEKQAGKELTTTSREFPVQLKGNEADIRIVLEAGLQSGPSPFLQVNTTSSDEITMKLKLKKRKAQAMKMRLSLLALSGLGKVSMKPDSFPPLADDLKRKLHDTPGLLDKLLSNIAREKGYLRGLGSTTSPTYSFDEIFNTYNSGISEDEIKAYVYYKQTVLGNPMNGWDKFYLSKDAKKREQQVRELYMNGKLFFLNNQDLALPVYAFGNMYDRELQLANDQDAIIQRFGEADGAKIIANQLAIIKERKPTPLSVLDVDASNRPKILAISEFSQVFKIKELRDEVGVYLPDLTEQDDPAGHNLVRAFEVWAKQLKVTEFGESSFVDVKTYLYNERWPGSKDPKEKAQLEFRKNEAIEVTERLFSKFLHEALAIDDQLRLDLHWNRLYNGVSDLMYHKIPIGFEASRFFKNGTLSFTPAQRDGIAFQDAVGSGINAYDVGVGKTMTAIISLANALQSGAAKRVLIVVPNPTFDKWVREIIGYKDPSSKKLIAGVLTGVPGVSVNEWHNLGKDIVSGIKLNKAVAEKSITILTYEGFRKIGFSDKVMEEMLPELASILDQQAGDSTTSRDLELVNQKYRDMLGIGVKGTIADIDTLGFDYLVIDEAHRCKNVFDSVKAQEQEDAAVKDNRRYTFQSATSETGQKAFFLCNYIQRRHGRNVMLLTATPFTNSPIEIYSMLALVAYDAMKAGGINNINKFCETFILPKSEITVNYKEELVSRQVVKSFNNRMVLQRLLYNHINYKTGEEAGVKRPVKINLPRTTETDENGIARRLSGPEQTLTYLPMTERQRRNQDWIVRAAREAAHTKNMGDILKALGNSMNNAFSPYVFEKKMPESAEDFVEDSPKILYTVQCIESVKKWHEDRNEEVSGQVIYSNRGKDYFPFIKEYLETHLGYKKKVKLEGGGYCDEVEIITSEVSTEKKEKFKDAFLAGKCKVIIGTATIREGIDLQTNGTVLYNLFPDWNPTDMKQLEGRIWRQGNQFTYVRIVMPLVENSMDVFVFQKLEEKTARLNDLWYRADRGNVLDLASIDPEEIKYALLTDVTMIARLMVESKIKSHAIVLQNAKSELVAASELKTTVDSYKVNRDKVLLAIRKMYDGFRTFGGPAGFTVEKWQEIINEAKQRTYIDVSASQVHTAFGEYMTLLNNVCETSAISNKDILAVLKKQATKPLAWFLGNYSVNRWQTIANAFPWPYTMDKAAELWKGYFAPVAKVEKTLLTPRGLTIDSDFSTLVSELRAEYDKHEKQAAYLASKEYLESVAREVEKKRAELEVDSQSVEQRSESFAKLNYLMSYKAKDGIPNSTILPKGEAPNKGATQIDLETKLKLRARKAAAMKMRLKLLALVA